MGGEQLDELEIFLVEWIVRAQPLKREDPGHTDPVAERDDDEAALHRSRGFERQDPCVCQLVDDELRLIVLQDPARETHGARL